MTSHKGWTRREWLALVGGSALASSPLSSFLVALQGRTQRLRSVAYGQTAPAFRLVSLYSFTAPARWGFDLFLNPRNQQGFVRNAQVANGFSAAPGSNNYTRTEYTLVPFEGLHVPRLWTVTVPKPGGGTRSLAPLMRNMLNIRGVNTANPDHAASLFLHQLPISADYSVAAMAANGKDRPFSVVSLGLPLAMGALADTLPVTRLILRGNDTNPIETLLSPFILPPSDAPVKEATVRESVQEAVQAFHTASKGNYAKHDVLESVWKQAGELSEQDVNALIVKWPALFAKYKALADAILAPGFVIPGVNDRPVMVGGTNLDPALQGGVIPTGDARGIFNPGANFRANMDATAANFAMIEFLLAEDLTVSISAQLPGISGLNLGGVAGTQVLDEHGTAAAGSVLLNSRYHLVVAACLLELIEAVKADGKWNQTVIQLASEFARSPRANGNGSDHGPGGTSVSIFTNQVAGPLLIGDIIRNSGNVNYPGTWGLGAPVQLPQTPTRTLLGTGHVMATLATLLQVGSPLTTSRSLLTRNANGRLVSVLPPGGFGQA